MSLEDDLINRIRRLEDAKWHFNKDIDYLIEEYKSKLNALRTMKKKND